MTQRIDNLFGNDSLAVIEYLRSKSDRYDIKEIKTTLKQNKKEQDTRIYSIREADTKMRHLERVIEKEKATVRMRREINIEMVEDAAEELVAC